ncbi:MAG: arylsulfatase [Anaerolineae bacterium]
MNKIGFLHTSPVHIETFDRLFSDSQDSYELVHLVDEPLLAKAMEVGITADIETQVQAHIEQLASAGCDQVVCSCSTIGNVAESVMLENVPVLRIDRPMAAAAIKGSQIVLIVAAIQSTLAPTRELLLDESKKQSRPIQIQELVLADSWAEFLSGNLEDYYQAIAVGVTDYLASSERDNTQLQPEVIVIAQASMAPAINLLQDITIPILASPEICVQYILSQ